MQCQANGNDSLSLMNGGQINHERSHQTFNLPLDSHHLWTPDDWLHIRFAIEYSILCLHCSVCLSSCVAPFGAVDVEGPCGSTDDFEENR
jgi:hypothetical protein